MVSTSPGTSQVRPSVVVGGRQESEGTSGGGSTSGVSSGSVSAMRPSSSIGSGCEPFSAASASFAPAGSSSAGWGLEEGGKQAVLSVYDSIKAVRLSIRRWRGVMAPVLEQEA